jgi:diamine N-acetyltransferase
MDSVEIQIPTIEDAAFLLELENDSSIWKVSYTTEKFNLKEIELFIVRNLLEGLETGQIRYLITKNHIRCGCIDLFEYDPQNLRAGVGIIIHPNFQHQGIAKAALLKLIEHSKTVLKLHQLHCTIMDENLASISLFKSVGFAPSGVRKDWTYFDGVFYDETFYQLFI